MTWKSAVKLKSYLLFHDSRRGFEVHKFETEKDLSDILAICVYEDLDDRRRELLRFLGVVMEYDDHVFIRPDPASEGVW